MPETGNITVTDPKIGSGWSNGKPGGNDAGLSTLHVPAAMLSGVQGKRADVNVPPKVVVRNSTAPPTGTIVTEGSNHFPGTSVSRTTILDCACGAGAPSAMTVSASATS